MGSFTSLASPAAVAQSFKHNRIVPALRSSKDVEKVARLSQRVVFLLGTSVVTYGKQMEVLREAGHIVFVHFDLIEGLKGDSVGFSFLMNEMVPDGIISTHKAILSLAKKNGLMRLLRVFMLDSDALAKGYQLAQSVQPDFVELLPGSSLPLLGDRALRDFNFPLIAGGLVTSLEQVHAILAKRVLAVSTSEKSLW
ncbi:MAG TPA: glycerol-3-phosphate responsive antiterminator [Synergistaceae bacterium]|nr:glycerol-3-phosphate responsive antiterminator [Synergistaceae bacterium]HPJ26345.1 glycerol-3-phosphate responsive antiterminator [Synergistaceae bacterium]HPQ38111.1 glycerol-3-phosphate responsive antiterminator [Synergistaceae bacterium]